MAELRGAKCRRVCGLFMVEIDWAGTVILLRMEFPRLNSTHLDVGNASEEEVRGEWHYQVNRSAAWIRNIQFCYDVSAWVR